jgi:hypothetical protein
MFDFKEENFRRRVHISHRRGGVSVRIERQNLRGLYFWMTCLSTVIFVMFCDGVLGILRQHRADILYFLPVLALGLACYAIALTIAVWGAFGVEVIAVEAGTLRWTLMAFKWSRTRNIPVEDITEIKAITPWHGLDNTVEVITHRKLRTIGDKLLRDEAIELAQCLRQAAGLLK